MGTKKMFITHMGSEEAGSSVWIQGMVTQMYASNRGLRSIVLDDATGVCVCVESERPAAPLDDLKRDDLVGKYVQVIGVIEKEDEGGQSRARVSTLKFFILADPNLESLWNMECL